MDNMDLFAVKKKKKDWSQSQENFCLRVAVTSWSVCSILSNGHSLMYHYPPATKLKTLLSVLVLWVWKEQDAKEALKYHYKDLEVAKMAVHT